MSLVISPADRATGQATEQATEQATVQAVGARSADVPRHRWESLAIFVGFGVLYSVVGYWLVVDLHVVGFETLDRFGRATMLVHDGQPRLAAVGADYPPLAVLLLTPFAAVVPLTGPLAVVPVASATFAALTMVVLNTMLRRARVALALRLAVLVALGLNPMVVMYAATGSRQFLWLAFVVVALGALVAWYVTADPRFVLLAGLAFAAATLAGYGSALWLVVSVVVVAAVLVRLGAGSSEIEGTVLGLVSPTAFVVAIWTVVNLAEGGHPLRWLTQSGDTAVAGTPDLSVAEIARATGELVLLGSPITLVVLPALVYAGIARSNAFALCLAGLVLVSVLAPGLAALAGLTRSPMVLNNALPVLVVSVVGAIWLARSAEAGGALVATGLVAALLVSIPWTFAAMETADRQGLERAFHDAVATGQSQEGAVTVDGPVVGYGDERAMADWIADHVDAPSSVLTDHEQTFAVVLLTGDPDLFLDRADVSDATWSGVADDPAGRVDYLLLSVDPSHDRLSARYPEAAAGVDPGLPVVAATDRYLLVAVPDEHDRDDRGRETPAATTPETPAPSGGVDGVVGEGTPEEVGVP